MNTIAQLGQLRNVPVDMTLASLGALNREQHQEELGLQDLMRQQQFNQAADPMRLQQMQTSNDISLEDLGTKRRTNREQDALSPAKIMAEYSGFMAKASANDLAMAEDRWRQLAMSNNPQERQLGIAGLQRTKEFLMERQKADARLAEVRQMGRNQLDVANVGAASRERVAELAARARQDMATLKTPKDWQEYAVRKQLELQQEGDLEARNALVQQIQYAQQMAERLRPPQQVLDPAVSGGMFTDPRGSVPPPPVGAQTSPAMSDRVRVVSPDGKTGTIPRSALEAAKAQGYRESK
jgi:hypothetical protein